jgi:hypothetical protein
MFNKSYFMSIANKNLKKVKKATLAGAVGLVLGAVVNGAFWGRSGSIWAYTMEKYNDQVENRVVVSPAKIELTLTPGKTERREMTIINRLGQKAEFKIVVEGLLKEGTDVASQESSLAAAWIKPEIDHFTLEHGERINLPLEIKIPKEISPGGYYVAVLAEFKGRKKSNSNVKLINRVGTSLLLTAPGNVIQQGKTLEFFTDKKFYRTGPIEFFVAFKNNGNIHLSPQGEISIYNFIGAQIAQIPLEKKIVLPGEMVQWKTNWKRKWLLGIYKVQLIFHFGNNPPQAQETSFTFWAFPLHLLLLIIIVIGVLYHYLKKFELIVKTKN